MVSVPHDHQEQLQFEYNQLRKEILQNDTHSLQILGATILLSGSIITISYGLTIAIALRGILFFIVWVIAVISLYQIIDRVRSTFIIASYLRLFVEPKLANVKWESKLAHFRDVSPKHGYNSLLTGQLWTYNLILVATLGVGSSHFIAELLSATYIVPWTVPIAGLLVWSLITAWLLWIAYKGYPDSGIKNVRYFDGLWQEAEEYFKVERFKKEQI